MPFHTVRLGTARLDNEGLRIGTVRYPPRGVPKADLAARNFYDVWYPNLAPSPATLKLARELRPARGVDPEKAWKSFERRYRAEMKEPAARRTLELLAALSHQTDFSIGCYCSDPARCHRTLLAALLVAHGAIPHRPALALP